VSLCAECSGRFDDLVGYLPRDFQNDVEEKERNVPVETLCRSVCWSDEGEKIREKRGPLLRIRGEEEKGEGM